ncbi:MAG: KpsF/GutQ family sugar-phosphate isomerase [Acidobacteriota bacterium]|nr:KpsF/GutQ family sugar-phosphate isomerase [Acidobacteriota bacterium]
MTDKAHWLETARSAMQTEGEAVLAASARLGDSLLNAVDLILGHAGKVVVTGMGKSGYVGRKIAATLQSTGTPAVFLHPSEAGHGDLGVCQAGDTVVMISKSGSTAELLDLVAPLREFEVRFIGILGNVRSPLAAEMDVVLDASVQREADPEGYTPTASTMVALSLGHALAVALMQARGFTVEHFRRYHPSGQLGHNLRLRVRDVMHSGSEVAWAEPADSLKHVVIEMSQRPLGAACVVAGDHRLLGLITDGDVRRALRNHDDIRPLRASDVMTASPVHIPADALIHEALCLMEARPSQIYVLPVLDPATNVCQGLIRLHDIYQARAVD